MFFLWLGIMVKLKILRVSVDIVPNFFVKIFGY